MAEPGSIKSPIFNLALKPLHQLQKRAYEQYQQDLEAYKKQEQDYRKALNEKKSDDLTEPTPPILKHYYCDNATVEKVQRIVTEQIDKGLIIAPDELSGFFNSFNQYRGGKGSDRDFWKSAADGGAIKVDRASDGTRFTARTSLGITGTIQPGPLQASMKSGDADGFWSRFMWVRLPLRRLPAPNDAPKIDLENWLCNTYEQLGNVPQMIFRLSPEARKTWHDWHELTEDQRLRTETPVERVLYPKYRDRAGRVALISHCLEYVSQGKEVPTEIPHETLEAAISFAKFCLNQTRMLYADLGVSSVLTGHLLRTWQFIQDKALLEIKPSDLQRSKRIKTGPKEYAKTPYCRELLEQLARLGYLIETGNAFSVAKQVEVVESKVESISTPSTSCLEGDTGSKSANVERLKRADLIELEAMATSAMESEEATADILDTLGSLEPLEAMATSAMESEEATADILDTLGSLEPAAKEAFWDYLNIHNSDLRAQLWLALQRSLGEVA